MVLCLHQRPPLERFRVLCAVCLVFDAIFMLIFVLSGMSASVLSAETLCYEQNGYSWHNILALSFIVSAIFAGWGVLLHGGVVTSGEGAPLKEAQLVGVSRYGHILVAWTFIAAVLEAIAYRQQPAACMGNGEAAVAQPTLTTDNGLTDSHVEAVWHLVSTVMWLVWVVGAVAAAMSAKRNIPLLLEARQAPDSSAERDGAQLVGVPVEDLPTGTVTGIAQPATGAPGAAPGAPELATFQGMPVAVAGSIGVDGVCQGMPVRDESGNVSRPSPALGFTKEV
ncbi:unnamed protein product [Symbiodinium necroappetens]|uniref:Uncharacterized protein n=2 Tax=Symbiodinium TaxID=2949 RepID=A0A812LFT9_9DINO|nr:hypothetical protein AK812_SmicGene30471 [Symbiodinium microadriaticum]CAE7244260.1 unnamed protein product [Symbiodinium necroappetens]CAE7250041.1 unnamed protein product [Symbiodinium microadriaticum]CAE7382648.1 unnamed protein product [Symbiodinium sp. KB8]